MAQSAEYVMEGHPDKVCDIIADAIVDDYVRHDIDAKIACEVLIAKELVVVAGEISSTHQADIDSLIRATLRDIGYVDARSGISAATCRIITSVSEQSPYLSQLVRSRDVTTMAASDQTVVVGFAVRNRFGLIPRCSYIAKRLAREVAKCRREPRGAVLRPDGKTLVHMGSNGNEVGEPALIVVSAQHADSVPLETVRRLLDALTRETLTAIGVDCTFTLRINPPTGVFHFGGPAADSGLTGRKVVADTYGPDVPCGGGALSGKDPSKIDRCATYAARWVAKSLVASGVCAAARISLTYVIGDTAPVAIDVVTEDPSRDSVASQLVREKFDLRPAAIIERLDLRRPIYCHATRMAHFGLDDELPWEVAEPGL